MTTICEEVHDNWRHRLREIVDKSRKTNREYGFALCQDGTITDIIKGQQKHIKAPNCTKSPTIAKVHVHSTKFSKGQIPLEEIDRFKRIIHLPSTGDIRHAIENNLKFTCIVNASRGVQPKMMCLPIGYVGDVDYYDFALDALMRSEHMADDVGPPGFPIMTTDIFKSEKFYDWLINSDGVCEIDVT